MTSSLPAPERSISPDYDHLEAGEAYDAFPAHQEITKPYKRHAAGRCPGSMEKLIEEVGSITVLKNELSGLREYIQAKSAKKEYLAKYHLGKYFHLKNENERAIKHLNQTLTIKKKYSKSILATRAFGNSVFISSSSRSVPNP